MVLGSSVKAVILAGGKGTRFRPYTDIIAKPMVPVGREEKPLLEHILSWIAGSGIKEFVFLVGHRGRQIRNYFADGSRWGVRIAYSWDTPEYTNTGGALLHAHRQGLFENTRTLLIWYGDILANPDIRELLKTHHDSKADATLVVAEGYQLPVGIAEVDPQGNITRIEEKPRLPLKVGIGILALQTHVLQGLEEELGTSFDIMAHLLPHLLEKKRRVKAHLHRGYWYDVGSLERHAKLDHSQIDQILNPNKQEPESPAYTREN